MSSRPSSRYDHATPQHRESHRLSRRHSNGQPPVQRASSAGARDPGTRDAARRRRSSAAGEAQRSPNEQHGRRSGHDHRTHDESHSKRRSSTRRGSAGQYSSTRPTMDKSRGVGSNVVVRPIPTPRRGSTSMPASPYVTDRDPMLEAATPTRGGDFGRKKSLVRPERRQNNPEDADYYYRRHAQNMNVMPSTTGRDPQLEDNSSESATLKQDSSPISEKRGRRDTARSRGGSGSKPNKLSRMPTKEEREREAKVQRNARIQEAMGPPSLWSTYCHLITFWCPNTILRCFGKKQKEQQRAWREKMGLLSIILVIMGFVGFLTFGFTEAVCANGGPLRLRINKVGAGYMIFHGSAYDLTQSHHPLARGISPGANVLWDLGVPHGGQDGSFLFQNVNGACKGLVTLAPGSDVPTNDDGDLAWYFPCNTYNQDGSSKPNYTIPYYLGYACHTARVGRENFYDLRSSGDVYFTWNDVMNSSRNLMVYSGDVLDLDLLSWFNRTQVNIPEQFAQLQNDSAINAAVRGKDVTLAFSTGENKQIAQCLSEIIKVGSIDTETVGCIASKVVLYVSLVFILSIVVIKFVLALLFQWFFCRKFAASKTSMGGDSKERKQQIEDWTEDIYRPPPKITDPVERNKTNRRSSFLPTTSRFTSPYAIERALNKNRPPPTTMASQQSTSRLIHQSGNGMYANNDRSDATLAVYVDSQGRPSPSDGRTSIIESHNPSSQRYSSVIHSDGEISGPQGFIHEAVVPQPPAEWQPFGFPLAHAICLITAYSEGPEGIRTTLDSVAMTDYPNSHKLLFVVCDGLIKGKGESMSTPDACVSMMKDHAIPPDEVRPFSYVAVASGSKRHNMAKIYAGYYDYGADSIIPVEKQQRVPMIVLVKCGTPEEANSAKPGNRGKRDSQIILMSFLQKVMFDERMTELEYEMFNGIWKITGISPDFYEITLMVDADTKVFPDSLTHMISAMIKDPEIMGLCGETKIANKSQSWVTMIQVFEYFISHHQAKSFESCFGGVTCLPGCFCMYRIKAPKGGQNYWVPILANPDIVEHYSENVVDTLHKKNLYLLGEDRYLSTLMLKTFPKRKQVFVPQAVCKTTVPDEFKVLLSQRRRWINSTVHNLMELVLVRDLCGTFCFSMQFVVFIDLVGCVVLPAAICFTIYVVTLGIKAAVTHTPAPLIPLILLALILGLPGVLIVVTAHRFSYVFWMLIYLLSLPIWNLVLPAYAFWHFDDFSWGDTRQTAGEKKGAGKGGHDGGAGQFDSSKITMKRWADFEQERRLRSVGWGGTGSSPAPPTAASTYHPGAGTATTPDRPSTNGGGPASPSLVGSSYPGSRGHERTPSKLAYETYDYP